LFIELPGIRDRPKGTRGNQGIEKRNKTEKEMVSPPKLKNSRKLKRARGR